MRALWSDRQDCSHNVSQKVKRIRRLCAVSCDFLRKAALPKCSVFQEPRDFNRRPTNRLGGCKACLEPRLCRLESIMSSKSLPHDPSAEILLRKLEKAVALRNSKFAGRCFPANLDTAGKSSPIFRKHKVLSLPRCTHFWQGTGFLSIGLALGNTLGFSRPRPPQ